MADLEAIWKLARADLVIATEDGGNDIFLWEHSVRVTKCAQYLARLPEAQSSRPDGQALLAACLYHDSGWVSRWRAREIERFEILLGSPSEVITSESVRIMQASLSGVIPAGSLEKASEIIRFRNSEANGLIEGVILLEADNLEEFGLGFLWTAIRRGICGGKGVQAVLDAWQRRIEYQFWTARLKDAFRFEPSRTLAATRLRQLEGFMAELTVQHEVEDVRRLVQEALGDSVSPVFSTIDAQSRRRR